MALPQGATEWGDDIAIPMNPIHGMWNFVPGQEVPLGASPDMLNCVVRRAMLTKRPGYTQFPDDEAESLGDRIIGIFSAQDVSDVTYLYAATPTDVFEFDGTDWNQLTGGPLTGTDERLMSWEVSQNAVVFSQGVDPVQIIAFAGTTYVALDTDCPPARYLTRFADRLYIAHTLESAAAKPFRVRRSVAQDHTDWIGVGAGFTDLAEFPYHIKGMRKLHSQLAVYTEQAISIGTRTEDPGAPARFDPVVTDVGLYIPLSLRGRNDLHFFVGNDDFYSFNGNQIESIGWAIRDSVYPVLNINKLHMGFGEILYDSQEYLAFLATGSSEIPNMVWTYNFARRIFYPWSVNGPCCSTRHRLSSGTQIDDLIGTIDEQTYEFDAASAQEGYPALLTGHDDGKIYRWGMDSLSDAGVSIPCYWQSKDFTAKDIGAPQNEKITMKALHIRYKQTGVAATLTIDYSIDGGSTWLGTEVVSLIAGVSGVSTASAFRQVTGDQVRFRMANNTVDETFQIIEFIPVFESPGSRVSQ